MKFSIAAEFPWEVLLLLFLAPAAFALPSNIQDNTAKQLSRSEDKKFIGKVGATVRQPPPETFHVAPDGGNLSSIQWGASGDIPVPGDYDGDGKADPAIFRRSDGMWRILGSKGTAWTNAWGKSGDIPVPGDYDGDGKTDVAVFRPSDGTWRIFGSTGTAWTNSWGIAGDIPAPADYDGDGKMEMAVFRPAEGTWYISTLAGETWTAKWGASGDIPLPGDFGGEGKATAVLFRPSEIAWYVSYQGVARSVIPWGDAGDIPAPGDYNGDGKTDIAIWRPSNGIFYISLTGGGTETIVCGVAGDLPVPADYDGDGKTDAATFCPSDGTWRLFKTGAKSRANQSLQYAFRRWQTEDGLPHNTVSAVLQARDGYLWIGTPEGLTHFDGLHFGTGQLRGQAVRSFCQTGDGAFWIAPEKGGLLRLTDGNGVHDFLPSNIKIKTLLESNDGSLWIGSASGLARYKDNRWAWFTKADGLIDDVVLAICEDRLGNLWVGTSGGLIRYKHKFAESYDQRTALPSDSIRALFCDHENNLWIGTGGGGLLRLQDGKFTAFKKRDGLTDDFVTAIFEDSRRTLWVGTMSGLSRRVGEKFMTESNGEGASYEAITCLTEDREGGVWVGTKEGLAQLQIRSFKSYTKEQGLYHNNVTSVYEDSRGVLWATTWGGGLSKLKDGKITSRDKKNSPLYDLLLSTCETRDGNLWFGADFDGGLFRYRNGTFTHYGTAEGIVDPAVRVICEDRKGNLWIGTTGALYQMRDGKFRRFTTVDGLAGNTIRAIYEDGDGTLWIGTNDGLTQRKDESFSSFTVKNGLSTNAVLSIYGDKERNLWIGTRGGGLNRFRNGTFTSYTTKQGIFNDGIAEILEDDRNNLWMSCFSGVFRVSKKELDELDRGSIQTLSCASYGKADGMSSVQCNSISKPAGWKGKGGRLWFPTTRGVVVVDPNAIAENGTPPPLVVEHVISDKRDLTLSSGENHLVIPPGKGELEFHYTALSFRAPEKNRFKYKLEGVDSEWVEAGNRRVAYYNNIKPRAYTFRVIGCNNDGVWNQTGGSVAFVLLPHFWQTSWFIGIITLMAIGMVAGIARFVTWKIVQRKLERLEHQHAVEKERTRIAQDMHDDLGARLTEIMFLSGIAEKSKDAGSETRTHVGRIGGAARELVQNLDAIVWAVNPQNDTLSSLAMYIHDYVDRFLTTSGIRARFRIEKDLPIRTVSSQTRHSVLLATKEALNNIAKHSACSEVQFELRFENDRLLISIVDDGCGFSPATVSDSGNGLQNMEERLRTIGGRFEIKSEPGKGTNIQFWFPVG